jgi:hypothetical protein
VQDLTLKALEHAQTKKAVKGLVDKARGMVYFAMENQKDFNYLAGEPSTAMQTDQLEYSSLALV